MASVAGRKKSVISPGNVQIDIPVGTNTLLNKAASQSTSLYQQCSALRSRLLRVHGFAHFFALSSPTGSFRSSAEVVNTVWDCFALGTPLCYLFNLLPPPITPIEIETDPRSVVVGNERAKKRAIALFAMKVKELNHGEQFTVTDLWDRTNSDGFVKVVNTVTHIVDRLPPDVFEEAAPPSPPSAFSPHDSFDSMGPDIPAIPTPANGPDAERNNIIRELVETERKYVQDLEVMQKYAQELSQSNTLDRDTIHLLFPNLNKLLNFQRRFLIRLEGTADMPWREQRWGLLFTDNEEEFAVYEPYCANYTNASELMLMEEQNLVKYNHLINAKSELPAFLIKPVQRICKYPLLLDQLLKKSSPVDYPHYEELKAGSAAAKRITDKINESQRRAENLQTVQNLAARVDDWKGHHVSQFGELLLDDIFIVTKSEVDREYHVFLFERIILCCKEDTSVASGNNKKVGKSNSLLKKPQVGPLASGLAGGSKKKMTPLLLKGRIYLNNVTEAKVVSPGSYSLNIWWKGDDDLEFFTLRCRNEEQVKQWETAVKRLIEKVAMRRASERSSSRLAHFSTHSGYPSSHPRNGTHDRGYSTHPSHASSHPLPYTNGHRPYRQSSPYDDHAVGNGITSHASGPSGYPPHDGFDPDDDLDDYSMASSISPTSGRTTPYDGRRGATTPGLDHYLSYERPRAQTEDANGPALSMWRSNVPGVPPGPSRSAVSRMGSAMSYVSEPGSRSSAVRPQLRSQYSSSRLRPPHDSGDPRSDVTSSPAPPSHNHLSRSRSASQPTAYVPKAVPPPMPSNGWDRVPASTNTTTMKRSSSSSQSTGEDSAYSPNSSSPLTPFGSSDSSLSGAVGRSSISSQDDPVKVKVHFGSDIFVIQVSRTTEYGDLVERVGKKIRLCGPRRDDGPLRVKYEDEEGDLISMRSTEDVDMAFGDKAQVVLHVT